VEQIISLLAKGFLQTLLDVAPIVLILAAFQAMAFARRPTRLARMIAGVAAVVAGITLFRVGLEISLIPTGQSMATEFVERITTAAPGFPELRSQLLLVAFVALLGFAATMIEPTLAIIAERGRELSGGMLNPFRFRLLVACGVGAGLGLGVTRILVGFPYVWLLVPLIALIGISSGRRTPIVPLALDSGAMATSVVTVPLIAALGVALAGGLPGRDPLTDGFGLVLLALLAPVALVLSAAQVQAFRRRGSGRGK